MKAAVDAQNDASNEMPGNVKKQRCVIYSQTSKWRQKQQSGVQNNNTKQTMRVQVERLDESTHVFVSKTGQLDRKWTAEST